MIANHIKYLYIIELGVHGSIFWETKPQVLSDFKADWAYYDTVSQAIWEKIGACSDYFIRP